MFRKLCVLLIVQFLGMQLTAVSQDTKSNQSKPSSGKAKDAFVLQHTITGTVRTGIMTPGGDCSHKWWLQTDTTGKQQAMLLALEPDDKVPDSLKDKHVQVTGTHKLCHGVEGSDFPVIVIESIKPM